MWKETLTAYWTAALSNFEAIARKSPLEGETRSNLLPLLRKSFRAAWVSQFHFVFILFFCHNLKISSQFCGCKLEAQGGGRKLLGRKRGKKEKGMKCWTQSCPPLAKAVQGSPGEIWACDHLLLTPLRNVGAQARVQGSLEPTILDTGFIAFRVHLRGGDRGDRGDNSGIGDIGHLGDTAFIFRVGDRGFINQDTRGLF